jgi:hypothetical protein
LPIVEELSHLLVGLSIQPGWEAILVGGHDAKSSPRLRRLPSPCLGDVAATGMRLVEVATLTSP